MTIVTSAPLRAGRDGCLVAVGHRGPGEEQVHADERKGDRAASDHGLEDHAVETTRPPK